MKLKRRKGIRKTLEFYRISYGLQPPYRVICDGNTIHVCHRKKMDIRKAIADLLDDQRVDICVTGGTLQELRDLGGDEFKETLDVATTMKKLKYIQRHNQRLSKDELKKLGSAESILNVVGVQNRDHYIVATQDDELREKLRSIPGVPIIFATKTMLILEQPSDASINRWKTNEIKKQSIQAKRDLSIIKNRGELRSQETPDMKQRKSNDASEDFSFNQQNKKNNNNDPSRVFDHEAMNAQGLNIMENSEKIVEQTSSIASKKRKRKGPKQPNPLSVKKPKIERIIDQHNNNGQRMTKDDENIANEKNKRKRKRNRTKQKNNLIDSNSDEEKNNGL